MKTHGLRVRLLTLAIAAGLCITAVLLGVQYLEYRKSLDSIGTHGERSLLDAETQRLDREASDLLLAHAAGLESALGRSDTARIARIGQTILASPIATTVSITNAAGESLYNAQKNEPWVAALTVAEQRSMQLTLDGNEGSGVVEIGVGRRDLQASAQGLRSQLERVERNHLTRKLWIVFALGVFITAVLAAVAWLLARRLERPIIELIRSAERIGEGDYTRPHAVSSDDEMADLGMALDRMRQNLRQTTITKDYLNSVLNSMNDAVLVTSPTGTITRANDAAVRLFGFPEQEIAGKPFASLIAESERENFPLDFSAGHARDGHCDAQRTNHSGLDLRRTDHYG